MPGGRRGRCRGRGCGGGDEDRGVGFLVPVLFALFAALGNALATVLQRHAALTVPQSDGFRFGLVRDLLRQPLWPGGILAVIAAGIGQAVALARPSRATLPASPRTPSSAARGRPPRSRRRGVRVPRAHVHSAYEPHAHHGGVPAAGRPCHARGLRGPDGREPPDCRRRPGPHGRPRRPARPRLAIPRRAQGPASPAPTSCTTSRDGRPLRRPGPVPSPSPARSSSPAPSPPGARHRPHTTTAVPTLRRAAARRGPHAGP